MIMKSNEIRIGNYLMELNSKDVFQVKDYFYDFLNTNLRSSKPIPLTEEWLVNYGFDKANYNKNYPLYFNANKTNYPHAISVSIYDSFCRITVVDFSLTTLKYVHEFQNLYFALTKEELTIK